MKGASYLIRLGSKRLGKDVTMPLENAKKVSIVTKQLSNTLYYKRQVQGKKHLCTTLTWHMI